MNIPSLVVLFVGGWSDIAAQAEEMEGKQVFLHDYVTSYPSVLFAEPKGGLIEFYRSFGHIPSSPSGLPVFLAQHRIRVITVAGPERYGLLTQTMRQSTEGLLDQEQRYYIALPPGERLGDAPETNVPEIAQKVEELLRFTKDSVFFVSLDAMWSMLPYQDIDLYSQAAKQVQVAAQKIIRKSLENNMRVLVVSDSSSVVGDLSYEQPAALPAVLIDQQLEGRRSKSGDYVGYHASGGELKNDTDGFVSTVLRLMQIPTGVDSEKPAVFADCLDQLV